MNSLERYKKELNELRQEMREATGKRKSDLLKKVRRMEKDIAEYQKWQAQGKR